MLLTIKTAWWVSLHAVMITSLAAANLSMLKTNAYGTLANACGALVFLCECPCVTSYMTVLI